MNASIVIPSYNRLEKLRACLKSIALQGAAVERLSEVVVVDDGSSDGTRAYLAESSRSFPFELIAVHADHAGPAAARNKGIDHCRGDIVIFMGDDTQAAPGLISGHLATHSAAAKPISVLGHTTWHPSLDVSPFMHYQENGGSQFAYHRIQDPSDCGWNFYYTTNVSSPKFVLEQNRFDERFPIARFEDMELGYRLDKLGYRIEYVRDLLVWHDHVVTFEQFEKSSSSFGEAAVIFHRIHQDEEVARAIGIHDAINASCLFTPAIEAARATVTAIEQCMPTYEPDPTQFGARGGYEILAQCYRLLIHTALITGIRRGLGLMDLPRTETLLPADD